MRNIGEQDCKPQPFACDCHDVPSPQWTSLSAIPSAMESIGLIVSHFTSQFLSESTNVRDVPE
jgi:hypothetical protein